MDTVLCWRWSEAWPLKLSVMICGNLSVCHWLTWRTDFFSNWQAVYNHAIPIAFSDAHETKQGYFRTPRPIVFDFPAHFIIVHKHLAAFAQQVRGKESFIWPYYAISYPQTAFPLWKFSFYATAVSDKRSAQDLWSWGFESPITKTDHSEWERDNVIKKKRCGEKDRDFTLMNHNWLNKSGDEVCLEEGMRSP